MRLEEDRLPLWIHTHLVVQMASETDMLFGAVIVLFFIWRFIRTHQLYRYSVRVSKGQAESISIKPELSRALLQQTLFGNRNVPPTSFYIRAFVFGAIALILFPFKDYALDLYWIILFLIIVYVPWCIVHGLLLNRKVN